MNTIEQIVSAIRECDRENDYQTEDYYWMYEAGHNNMAENFAKAALNAIREPSPHAIAKAADDLDISPTLAYAVWVTMVDFILKEDEK